MEVTARTRNVPARVPPALLRTGRRVLRPADAAGHYAHPRPEFARLERSGALRRLATGYYAVVPDDRVGLPWLPELEAVAHGIALTSAPADTVALMGLSAARVHGAIPRAIGVAVIAAQRHRRTLRLLDRDAEILFVRRDVHRLDLQRHRSELADGYVTSVEQTILDLAARPELGGMPEETRSAVRALLPRAEPSLLEELARSQRSREALRRAQQSSAPGGATC